MVSEKDRQLYTSLRKIGRFLHDHTGKKVGQNRALLLLNECDIKTQRELQTLMEIKSSSMSEMIVKLENADLIKREKCQDDQRVILLSLTNKGKMQAEAEKRYLDEMMESLFMNLHKDEKDVLFNLLFKLSNHFDDLKENGALEMLERKKGNGNN